MQLEVCSGCGNSAAGAFLAVEVEMKQLLWIPLGLFLLSVVGPAQEEVVDKDWVIRMVKGGIGDDVIIPMIRAAKKLDINLTGDSVLAMKEAGVSPAVLKALVERRAALTEAPQPAAAAPERPLLKSASGPSSSLASDLPRLPVIFIEEVTADGQVVTSSETLTEAIKTLHKKNMQVVTVRDRADYLLRITREQGKKSWRKDVKVVLSDRAGTVVYANSTRSIGGAAGDVADFILKRGQ